MGRKRWRERRGSTAGVVMGTDTVAHTPGKIRCGHPYGDGSFCMAPASFAHALTHQQTARVVDFADELGMPVQPWQQKVLAAAREMKAAGISGADVQPIRIDPGDRAIGEAMDQVIRDDMAKAYDQDEAERRETEELLNRADRMVPAKGLYETISSTGALKADLTDGSYRRPTYDVLKAAAAERQQFTTEQARAMLSAALGTRPHLAARVIDRLGPVLAGELARAVDAAVQQRIGNYLHAERAELDRLYADQLAKLHADQERRGRDVNAERWTTPSRLS